MGVLTARCRGSDGSKCSGSSTSPQAWRELRGGDSTR
jgi:hypothetical protein